MNDRYKTLGSARQAVRAKRIDAPSLKKLLNGDSEFALLDVRETGVFSSAQIFYSVSMPLSHLESRVGVLVPHLHTPLVLVDEHNEGLADQAVHLLSQWGYTNISVLDGGIKGWEAAGFQIFSGLYVPNKAFGEFIEHSCQTPYIDAATLSEWKQQGKDIIILDSRPFDEYQQFSIPGGINCPGAELVHRTFGLAKNPETTIVINCAGRTRGIIGAQSLINAQIPNPVVTLKNGTAGWYLNGGQLAEGANLVAPPPDHAGLEKALHAAQMVADKFNVQEIENTTLQSFLADETRTTFVLDVRTPSEYESGHLPGSRSAPGGQIIQSIDHYVGVRRSRIVLVDDNGVRAKMTASWLIQFGRSDVYVLRDGLTSEVALVRGPEPTSFISPPPAVPTISTVDAKRHWDDQTAVFIDFSDSLAYRRAHIPGAWFAIRSQLRQDLPPLTEGKPIIVVSPDGVFAQFVANNLRDLTSLPIQVLEGGMNAWRAIALPMSSGLERLADQNNDVWYSAYDYDNLHESMNAYLSWEVGLVEQLEREEHVDFMPAK